MAKWHCYARVVGSSYLGEVEAETEAEAEEKAAQIDKSMSLCHQCSRVAEDLEIESIEVEKE